MTCEFITSRRLGISARSGAGLPLLIRTLGRLPPRDWEPLQGDDTPPPSVLCVGGVRPQWTNRRVELMIGGRLLLSM